MKTVPYVPLSHPFVERLIGTVRREYLDRTPFWNAHDLDRKLLEFKDYYNRERVHQGLDGDIPEPKHQSDDAAVACLDSYRWKKHCRGLYPLPVAA